MEYPVVSLSDCCEIKPPKSEAKKLLKPDELVSFVPMALLGINRKGLALDKDKKLADVSGSYTYFADNDVLLAKITPCFENGKLGIAQGLTNGIGFGSSEFIVFRPNQYLETDYLYYFLNQPSFRDHGKAFMTGAVGHKRVPKDFIQNTQIPLPPIPEQQRIVAILDQAFVDIEKARANAEQNLKNARELSIASIKEMLLSTNNVELLTIDQLTDVTTDYVANGSFAALAANVEYKREKDYAVLLRLVDHSSNYKKDFVYINQKAFTFLKKSVVAPNDIILSNVGARLGTVFRAPDLGMPMSLGPNSILIKSTKYGDYLYCWLHSAHGQAEINSIVSGAGQPKFNKTLFRKIRVPVPKSASERTDVVESIKSITNLLECLEGIYSEKLFSLDELKQSLLQKAFSGELTKGEGRAA